MAGTEVTLENIRTVVREEVEIIGVRIKDETLEAVGEMLTDNFGEVYSRLDRIESAPKPPNTSKYSGPR
jgi:hypothetical protein